MNTNSASKHQESPATQAKNPSTIFAVPEPAPDRRPSPFLVVMDCLTSVQLSPAAFALGRFLAKHARYAEPADRRRRVEPGEIFVYWGQRAIATKMKKSLRQVNRLVRALVKAGLEVRQRPRRGASYVFVPVMAEAASFQTTRKATGRAPTQENQENTVCSSRFKHFWCSGRVHVPTALHQEFARLAPSGFDLVAWYVSVDQSWSDKAIGDDSFTFWRSRWRERFGTTRAEESANRRLARNVEAMRSAFPRWCFGAGKWRTERPTERRTERPTERPTERRTRSRKESTEGTE